jgi:hypothetical protein
MQNLLGVVIGHHAVVCAAAFHATYARAELQFANIHIIYYVAIRQQFIAYDIQHLVDIAIGAGASV